MRFTCCQKCAAAWRLAEVAASLAPHVVDGGSPQSFCGHWTDVCSRLSIERGSAASKKIVKFSTIWSGLTRGLLDKSKTTFRAHISKNLKDIKRQFRPCCMSIMTDMPQTNCVFEYWAKIPNIVWKGQCTVALMFSSLWASFSHRSAMIYTWQRCFKL